MHKDQTKTIRPCTTSALKPSPGDVRADGHIYFSNMGRRNVELWLSPQAYRRARITSTRGRAKKRAADAHVPFDVTIDYLVSIFPADGLCPALGTPLVWGGCADNSPSLDRIIPERGYVRGNVVFLSTLANRIKTNATTDEIIRVAEYLKGKLN